VGRACLKGGSCRLVIRSGMSQRNGAAGGNLPDEFHSSRLLRGNGHQPHLPAAGCVQPVKQGCIRGMEILSRLGTPLGIGQKRPLQMDTGTLGAILRAHKSANRFHGGQQLLLLQRHGSRQKGCHTAGGIVARELAQPLRASVREILVHRAVGMDIHKTGNQIPPLGIHIPNKLADSGDPAVFHSDRSLPEASVQIYPCIAYDHGIAPAFLCCYFISSCEKVQYSRGVFPTDLKKTRLKFRMLP